MRPSWIGIVVALRFFADLDEAVAHRLWSPL
jgi:hypothetical protein